MKKTKKQEFQVIFNVVGMPTHVVVFADDAADAKNKGEEEAKRRGWDPKLLVFQKAVAV